MFTCEISISTRQDAEDAAVRAGLETVFSVFPLTTNTFIFLMLTLSPGSHLQHNDISINMSRRFTHTLSYAYACAYACVVRVNQP